MTVFRTRPVPILNWSLLPAAYGSWGVPKAKYLERATTVRPITIMPWNDHVVAEGYVPSNDMNLQRALRDNGVLQ